MIEEAGEVGGISRPEEIHFHLQNAGPPVPALECRRARRLGRAGGAERRGAPSPTAPRTTGSFIGIG